MVQVCQRKPQPTQQRKRRERERQKGRASKQQGAGRQMKQETGNMAATSQAKYSIILGLGIIRGVHE